MGSRASTAIAAGSLLAFVLAGCGIGATPPASSVTPTLTSAPAPSSTLPGSAAPTTGSVSAMWPTPGAGQLPAATTAAFETMLGSWVASGKVPGVAAAVVSAMGAWAGAAGVDGAGSPIEPTSAFGIGSVTKTATAAELLLLASQGKLDLDSPVTRYVTLPFDAVGATVRQLATMQSGFPSPTNADMDAAIAKDLHRRWTAPDVLGWGKDAPRLGTLGGAGKYNGLNYQVLSLVIEKVTGLSLAAAMRRDLLAPAGLDRMWLQVAEQPAPPLAIAQDPPGLKIVDASSGYLPSLAAASTGNGAAGMAADAPTLAQWGYLLYGGRVIDSSLVETMTTANVSSEFDYGFGTMCDPAGGDVGHGGDYIGYSAMLLAWPKTHVAIAVIAPVQGRSDDGVVPSWAFDLYARLAGG